MEVRSFPQHKRRTRPPFMTKLDCKQETSQVTWPELIAWNGSFPKRIKKIKPLGYRSTFTRAKDLRQKRSVFRGNFPFALKSVQMSIRRMELRIF